MLHSFTSPAQHQPQLNSALCVRSSAEAFVCSYPLFYSKMRSNTGSSALTSSFSQYTRVHNSWILLSCSYHDNLPALSQPQPVSIFSLRETPRHSRRICSSVVSMVPSHHQPAGGILQHITHHRLGARTRQQENIKCFFIHSKPLKVQVNGIKSF